MGLKKEKLKLGFKIQEYRKLKLRWCKLERMFEKTEATLRMYRALYITHINNGGKPFLKE